MHSSLEYAGTLIIIILLLFAFCHYSAISQEIPVSFSLDSLPKPMLITFSSDKISNIFIFGLGANIGLNTSFGNFSLKQNFRSRALLASQTSFRDDQELSIKYGFPTGKLLQFTLNQNWILSSDSRSIGLDKLERLNVLAGLKFSAPDKSFVEFRMGAEQNTQVNVESRGIIMSMDGSLSPVDIDGYMLESSLSGELLRLSLNRTNGGFNINGGLRKAFDKDNSVRVNASYKLFNRDFISAAAEITDTSKAIESRLEKQLNTDILLEFQVADNLGSKMLLRASSANVGRSFDKPVAYLQSTKVLRGRERFHLLYSGEGIYTTGKFMQTIGMTFEVWSESYSVEKKFEIDKDYETYLRTIEQVNDYNENISKLFFTSNWAVSTGDSISASGSLSIDRRDTPSSMNNDDRDELWFIGGIRYSKKFSEYLSAGLTLETQLYNLVYLKKERSAENNHTRILRLSPDIRFKNSIFSINPQFEVLANYTVYDFEGMGNPDKSYRQISYNDSICIYLGSSLSLQSRINIHYNERGTLMWGSFSEIPQTSYSERFMKLILFERMTDNISLACGGRYYYLAQNYLSSISTSYIRNFSQYSLGPEVIAGFNFNSGTVFLQGWYEILYLSGKYSKSIPNLQIYSTIRL